MDNDDQPVGRMLSRREALRLLGLAGANLLAGCGAAATRTGAPTSGVHAEAATSLAVAATAGPSAATAPAATTAALACVVSPALTEGPYFVDEQLNRSDIRADPASRAVSAGAALALTMRLWQVSSGSCAPLAGALVDVWHCDAQGSYSDVTDTAQGFDTQGQQFLRGQQVSDASGQVQFTTIYPGWYSGRAVHIHFKVRAAAGTDQTYEFTSQLFFDEALTDQVHAQAPYAAKGQRDTPNSADGIYRQGGDQLLLAVSQTDQGYASTFNVGVDLSAPSAPAGGPGGPPPGSLRPSGG